MGWPAVIVIGLVAISPPASSSCGLVHWLDAAAVAMIPVPEYSSVVEPSFEHLTVRWSERNTVRFVHEYQNQCFVLVDTRRVWYKAVD